MPPRLARRGQSAAAANATEPTQQTTQNIIMNNNNDGTTTTAAAGAANVRPLPAMYDGASLQIDDAAVQQHYQQQRQQQQQQPPQRRLMADTETIEKELQMTRDGKVSAKNAWDVKLIDHMQSSVDSCMDGAGGEGQGGADQYAQFAKAATLVESGAKVWTHRVESTYLLSNQMLRRLLRNDKGGGKGDDDGAGEGAEGEDGAAAAAQTQRKKKRTLERTVAESLEEINLDNKKNEATGAKGQVSAMFRAMTEKFEQGHAQGLLMNNVPFGTKGNMIIDRDFSRKLEDGAAAAAASTPSKGSPSPAKSNRSRNSGGGKSEPAQEEVGDFGTFDAPDGNFTAVELPESNVRLSLNASPSGKNLLSPSSQRKSQRGSIDLQQNIQQHYVPGGPLFDNNNNSAAADTATEGGGRFSRPPSRAASSAYGTSIARSRGDDLDDDNDDEAYHDDGGGGMDSGGGFDDYEGIDVGGGDNTDAVGGDDGEQLDEDGMPIPRNALGSLARGLLSGTTEMQALSVALRGGQQHPDDDWGSILTSQTAGSDTRAAVAQASNLMKGIRKQCGIGSKRFADDHDDNNNAASAPGTAPKKHRTDKAVRFAGEFADEALSRDAGADIRLHKHDFAGTAPLHRQMMLEHNNCLSRFADHKFQAQRAAQNNITCKESNERQLPPYCPRRAVDITDFFLPFSVQQPNWNILLKTAKLSHNLLHLQEQGLSKVITHTGEDGNQLDDVLAEMPANVFGDGPDGYDDDGDDGDSFYGAAGGGGGDHADDLDQPLLDIPTAEVDLPPLQLRNADGVEVQPLSGVEAIKVLKVQHATVPTMVDVGLLRNNMWQHTERLVCNGQSKAAVVSKAEEPKQESNCQEGSSSPRQQQQASGAVAAGFAGQPSSFSQIVANMLPTVHTFARDGQLSPAFFFFSMLFLANEHNLCLSGETNKDVTVRLAVKQ